MDTLHSSTNVFISPYRLTTQDAYLGPKRVHIYGFQSPCIILSFMLSPCTIILMSHQLHKLETCTLLPKLVAI